jgi:DinB family protein
MTMPADVDAILRGLEAMPADLQRAAAEMGEGALRTPPAGGGFSLVEHAWHLADLEREGFGERIRRLLSEADPQLADFDGARAAAERSYRAKPLWEAIAAFAAARTANLVLLRTVPAEAWSRSGYQEGVGPITLRDVPRMMGEHDDSHRAEIAGLLSGIKTTCI